MIDESWPQHPSATSRYAVNHRAARRYLAATGDSAPANGPLPILFSTVCSWKALSDLVVSLCRDNAFSGPILHLAHRVDQVQPLRAGMTVDSGVLLRAVRPSALGSSLIVEARGSDEGGKALFISRSRILLVGLVLERVGDERWGGEPSPGSEGWTHEVAEHCTPELVQEYADASGDHNPVHLSDEAARAAGYGGPIVHGMLLLVLAARTGVALFAGGNPARVRSVSGRFVSPVLAGDTVSIRYCSVLPPPSPRTVTFDVRSSVGLAVRRGALEIDAPP